MELALGFLAAGLCKLSATMACANTSPLMMGGGGGGATELPNYYLVVANLAVMFIIMTMVVATFGEVWNFASQYEVL